MAKRSLKKNFLYQVTWQILLVLVPLVTTPYLSRTLGAEQVGVFSYTQAITNYFVLFALLGMSTYGVRAIAACGSDIAKRSKAFWGAYGSQLLVGVIVGICYVIYMLHEPAGGILVAAVWGMWVLSAVLDVSWLLFGVEEFKIPTIRSIITKLLSVVAIFVFVKGPEDLWLYCAIVAAGFLANQLLIWPFVHKYVRFAKVSFGEIVSHFLPNLRLFIPVVAISLYTALNKVMLGMMGDMTQVGYFEYANKLALLPLSLVTAMGTVMLPRMTLELKEGHKEHAFGLLENSIWVMLVLAFALMFGIMGIAPELATVFLGPEFTSAAPLMAVMALIIPIVSLTNLIGRQYLIPTERDGLYTISVCIGAVVSVVANLILIPYYAALGAAVSAVLAEVAVLVVQYTMARKEIPIVTYIKSSIPFVVCGFLMFLAVRATATGFNEWWGMSVQGLVLEIVVGVVVFAALALIWCVLFKDVHFKQVLGRVRKK